MLSQSLIERIMNGKKCTFESSKISVNEVEKLLASLDYHKPCGMDYLNSTSLKL